MPNEQVVGYLKENKEKFSKEVLSEQLKQSGYPEADIAEGVNVVYGDVSVPVPAPAPTALGFFDFKMNKYLILLAVALYGVSMFLPGIVYKPDFQDNVKNGPCSYAIEHGFRCQLLSNGYECSLLKNGEIESPSNRQRILEYCGDDWNIPVAEIHYGYQILLLGWFGLFAGIFAWLGNPLFVKTLLLIRTKRYQEALYIAIASFAVGLTAFMVHRVPRNEGGVNDYIVDHLGIGYYVWLASFIALAVYSYQKKLEVPIQQPVSVWSKVPPWQKAVSFVAMAILIALAIFVTMSR